jgi:Ca2+-binding RTX toxin-like protein
MQGGAPGTDGGAVSKAIDRTRIPFLALLFALGLLLVPLASQAAAMKCNGKKVTIKGTAGNDHIVGKKASDVIYGGGGNDVITGGANGNDTICGGPGDDVIHGGRGFDALLGEGGHDKLEGETGSDMLDGGAGDDTLGGSKGGDNLHGGSGDDSLIAFKGPDTLDGGAGVDFLDGQQGSDEIDGGGGDDKLVGDKGNDKMRGGPDDDRLEGGPGDDPVLDGDGGADEVIGGAGIDDANGGDGDGDIVRGDNGTDKLSGGPGVNDIVSYASASRGGIQVNLAVGRAKGDGHDNLSDFEDVVGSPQGDTLVGDGSPNRLDGGVGDDTLESGGGGGEAFGGPGTDDCSGFEVETSCGPEPGPPPGGAYVVLNQGLDGSSLVVQGGGSDDDMRIALGGSGWTVSDNGPIAPGDGCSNPPGNTSLVVCPALTQISLVVVTGGNGNDRVAVDDSVPGGAHLRINGNAGNDELIGGKGDDVLEAGENYNSPDNGNDTLVGNEGSDVLYSDPGADNLSGGAGNDLLVNSVATCQGHTYNGGPGEDTVSYARSNDNMRVTLGGSGGPAGCGNPDHVGADNESLEGSDGPDVLVGDNSGNSLLGHLGADTLIGRGGDDFVDAADGHHDKEINCGGGGDEAIKDGSDPQPVSC